MIYANNNGIIPMNEGLIDMIKKAFCKKVHKKVDNYHKSKTPSNGFRFTNEEIDMIEETINNLFKDNWNQILDIIKKIISETEAEDVKKGFKFNTYKPTNTWITYSSDQLKNLIPVITSNSIVDMDVYNAEPKAHTEYEGPIVQELWDLADRICSAIEKFGRENNIKLHTYIDGDWDRFSIFLCIPCKSVLSKNKENTNFKNESGIFKYVDLL